MGIERVFLIVLDSFGIGELPDAGRFGDEGSNTLASVAGSPEFSVPNMAGLGLFNIDGVSCAPAAAAPAGGFARCAERSAGKDTTMSHWEIAGIVSPNPMPTYPHGFPEEVIRRFTELTGYGVLCNGVASGTQVILDYGREHLATRRLIVYTSADSVFQIAAHESIVPREELYRVCRIARGMLTGEHAVGRVIARPFEGEYPNFRRTTGRHDFSLEPPADTVLDILKAAGRDSVAVGKISDIFAGRGVTRALPTTGNDDGMAKTMALADEDFHGLCFTNLVDFDMLYGHRNDVPGYAAALTRFDAWLGAFLPKLRQSDLLLITADHGCDPATPSTDHSREYTPLLAAGPSVRPGTNLGTRSSFADIGATALDALGLLKQAGTAGASFARALLARP